MSTATVDIREIFARIECGICGVQEAKYLKGEIQHLVFELCCDDKGSWHQCRFCHRKKDEGHDATCLAAHIE
jgi:hypothetical protein